MKTKYSINLIGKTWEHFYWTLQRSASLARIGWICTSNGACNELPWYISQPTYTQTHTVITKKTSTLPL